MHAPLHPDEPTRVAALDRYRVLDTPPEREFDEMARLAGTLCETPIAAVSFVAERRQWFKAEVGLGVRQNGRDVSVCAYAILGDDEVFEIPDLAGDPRTADNPHVTGAPWLRFYASAPLRARDGQPIGALCVMDRRPRSLSRVQRLALRTLGNQVMDQLELRRVLAEQRDSEVRALARERRQRFLLALEDAMHGIADPDDAMREASGRLAAHLGADRCAYVLVAPDGAAVVADDRGATRRVDAPALGATPGSTLRAGLPVTIESVDDACELSARARDALRAEGVAAAVCMPLRKAQRLVGALAVAQRTPRRWARDEVSLIADVAARCWETLERLQAEQRASRERRHAELALGAGRMGLWELDPRAGRLRLGDGMDAILGLDPAQRELDAAVFCALVADEEDRARVRAALARLRHEGGGMEIEYPIRRADTGELRWILTRGTRVADGDAPGLLAGVCVDHTSRKLAEHRLLEADARKDEFLAMLAHELRNPLAPLANALHVLRRSASLGPEARDVLSMADRQLHQLRRLVDDLLDVGRVTRGRIALRREPMPVAAAVHAAVESTAGLRDARRQRLGLSLPDATLRIVADPVRVAQILGNLLDNASRYTPEGGSIRVEAHDAGDAVEIRVVDDGIGIEPSKLPFLFELFSQIDATIDRARGGLGIGLAMVRRLVELHGGTVRADSAGPGRGSSFAVRLPRDGRRSGSGSDAAASAQS